MAPLAVITANRSCDCWLPRGIAFVGTNVAVSPGLGFEDSGTTSAPVPKFGAVRGIVADPRGERLTVVGYVVLRSTLYVVDGPTFAENTSANFAVLGVLTPRPPPVPVPPSG